MGTEPLMAMPKIVGSKIIFSSGRTITGSSFLRVAIVAEQRIIPMEVAASEWSTSTEFGSANSPDKENGVV